MKLRSQCHLLRVLLVRHRALKAGELYKEPIGTPMQPRNLNISELLKLLVFQINPKGEAPMYKNGLNALAFAWGYGVFALFVLKDPSTRNKRKRGRCDSAFHRSGQTGGVMVNGYLPLSNPGKGSLTRAFALLASTRRGRCLAQNKPGEATRLCLENWAVL
jgi:hypothetical protein